MGRCHECGRNMRLLVSCVDHGYKLEGKRRPAITYGSTGEGRNENIELPENCWDCGTPKGGYHHPGCLEERCPLDGTPYMVCRHPKEDAIRNRERSWERAAMNMPYRGMVTNPDGSVQHDVERAREAYRAFHQVDPSKMRRIKVPETPKAAYALGRLLEVVYKPEGKSERRDSAYDHKFGDFGDLRSFRFGKLKPILAVSDDGNQLLIIRDVSKFHVNERGIVG